MLQASVCHPDHGVILANPFSQFDGTRFHDVSYVRAYRKRMLKWMQHDRPGFGLDFGVGNLLASIKLVETNVALYKVDIVENFTLSIVTQVIEDGTFLQYAKAKNSSTECILLPYTFRMNTSLNRASYGQLTEGR